MLIIGIAGGTGSGKTTVVNKILNSFPAGEVAVMPQDSYYKDSSHVPPELRSKINFDEPAAIEWTLLVDHLEKLKRGECIDMPVIPSDFDIVERLARESGAVVKTAGAGGGDLIIAFAETPANIDDFAQKLALHAISRLPFAIAPERDYP